MTVITPPATIPATPGRGTGSTQMNGVTARANRGNYAAWLDHVSNVNGCIRPVRLAGRVHTLDPATGDIVATRETTTMPDGVLYVPCGDRRATVCPACAETYRADTYHLIKAGLVGGKNVPESVATHPAVFTTLTAPSFGPVHSRVQGKNGKIKPCRVRRTMTLCEHGKPTWCAQRHAESSPCLGTPICQQCYDYHAHAVWNGYASELWRRTTIRLRRFASQLGKQHSVTLDISFGKVAEYQHRGVIHFHAIVRLDQRHPTDPDQVLCPPATITAHDLDALVTRAVTDTAFTTPDHPGNPHTGIDPNPAGWAINWGTQLVNRPLARVTGDADITENMVAAYVAKYATKATEITGFSSRRLTIDTIGLVNPDSHPGRLALACWDLGANPHRQGNAYADGQPVHPNTNRPVTPERAAWHGTYGRLARWAHMLGFGGHFASKSRRYGPTRKALKAIRRRFQRAQQLIRNGTIRTADHLDHDDTTLIVGELAYAGIGYLSPADAQLALTSAAKAREYRQTSKEERACHTA